jgi:hypothetical protein
MSLRVLAGWVLLLGTGLLALLSLVLKPKKSEKR